MVVLFLDNLHSVCLGSFRFLHNAREKLAKTSGKWWSGGSSMKDSQVYPLTFAGAVTGLSYTSECQAVVPGIPHVELSLASKVADILNMRNCHSPLFLMGTDIGRMLDHIAISLVHQALQLLDC